jgi:hypothetical protein
MHQRGKTVGSDFLECGPDDSESNLRHALVRQSINFNKSRQLCAR